MVIANKIPIRLLVEKGYLKKDDDNCTIGVNCVTDPRDKSSLDNNYIDIYSYALLIVVVYLLIDLVLHILKEKFIKIDK